MYIYICIYIHTHPFYFYLWALDSTVEMSAITSALPSTASGSIVSNECHSNISN